MASQDLFAAAHAAVEAALGKGAQEASARTFRVREVEVKWRDGHLEQVNEATTRGLGLSLYVDGCYSNASTSDLRPEALDTFIADSIALTRALAKDPFRSLPDPKLYEGQAEIDLFLEDPTYSSVTPEERRTVARDIETAARSVKGAEAILSVTTSFSDTLAETWRVTSNGFWGSRRDTSFFISAEVSAKDPDGRKPEDYAYGGSRFVSEVPEAEQVGREAAERALSRLGATKGESAVLTMAVENRAAGRMPAYLLGSLSGGSLQQKRSFLEGKLGQAIASPILTLVDDPLVPKGFGSRLYDGEGIAAKRMPVIEAGVLTAYYIDTYYGKKLQMAPTTAGPSNLVWTLGNEDQAALLSAMKDGILVTGFLGGNSNGLTGDFSLGVQGFRIRGGKIAEPVGEMNISGNHLDLWKKLVAVGNDPYPYSSMKTPTLVFEGVQFAGT